MSIEETLSMLSKFENNIKIAENQLINYCNNHVSNNTFIFEDFTSYSAIIGQSSTYVRAGEKLEIIAGMGSFSTGGQPEIIINGRKNPLDATGTAVSKFQASPKAGKHFVPVQIGYTDQDGERQIISKTVEYTVAKEVGNNE